MKKAAFALLCLLLPLLLLYGIGEIGIRVYYYVRYTRVGNSFQGAELDPVLGWRGPSGYRYVGTRRECGGRTYEVRITFNEMGFRLFGDPASPRPHLLVLGDSIAQALDVSDDQTFYARFTNELPVEVFAYAVSGYGTLQEEMILEQYADALRPSAVLFQLSDNDIINNDFDLERRSFQNNNRMVRPYLQEDGSVRYAMPRRPAALRELAVRHLPFLYWLLTRCDRLAARFGHGSDEAIIAAGPTDAGLQRSAAITRAILERARARVPSDVPIYAFLADEGEPFSSAIRQAAAEAGVRFIAGVPQALLAAEARGEVVRAADCTHWNGRGHGIAADVLLETLRRDPRLNPATGPDSRP